VTEDIQEIMFDALRVEFLLKTDSGYPKDTGVNKPFVSVIASRVCKKKLENKKKKECLIFCRDRHSK